MQSFGVVGSTAAVQSTCATVLWSIVLDTLTAVMLDVYRWLLAPCVFTFFVILDKSRTAVHNNMAVSYRSTFLLMVDLSERYAAQR